jgi:hypothetical protein
MTNHSNGTTERVASEVRAEMARQRKTATELADVIGVTQHTAGRRLSGAVPFTLVDLVLIGEWLDIDPRHLMPHQDRVAS